MNILLKHTLRSVRDNRGQLIVILLTVTVVSAIFFVTLTIGGLFTNLQTSIRARLGSDTDITLSGGVFARSRLEEFTEAYALDIEYTETYLQLAGLFRPGDGGESKAVLVEAADIREFSSRHSKELIVYDSYEYSYGYPEVWVGKSFAEENNLKAGDTVEIYIEMYDSYRLLTVSYIFENYGFFANNVINNVLMDFSTAGNKGMLSIANIKLSEGADKEEIRAVLADFMGEGVTVADSVDNEEIERIVGNNQNLLNIALIFVTALMAFILFTSYLVVAKKRVSELAVFKSAGASNAQIAAMLVVEGLIYGFAGAVVGAVAGRLGMGIAVSKVIPNFPDAVSYTVWDYILSVLFGMAVSALSAAVPVVKVSRESVRKATSDRARAVKRRSLLPVILSTAALLASALLVAFMPSSSLIWTLLLVVCAAVSVYFVIPFVIRAVSSLAFGRGVFRLSGMSVKRNPLGHTLSGLVGFVIVFTFIVVSIVNVIIGAITPFNSRFEADYVAESISGADMTEMRNELIEIYGVTGAYLYFYDTFVWETDTRTEEYTVYGADDGEALAGLCKQLAADVGERFDRELNPVVISYDLAGRFGLSEGDAVRLTLGTKEQTGATLHDEFTVVGIDYTATANDRVMVIRSDSFRVDGKEFLPAKSMIFVNTDKDVPSADLYREMRDRAEASSCYILKFDDWAYATSVGIRGVVALMRILQVIVSAVALVGIVNLTIVTLYERRREFNVLKASGLDGGGYVSLAVFESLIIAVSGAAVGIGLSMIVNLLMPVFANIIDRFIEYRVFPWELAVAAAACAAVYSAVYVLSALFRKRKQAVERNTL